MAVTAYLCFVFFTAPLLRGAMDRGPLTVYYLLGLLAAYAWVRRGGVLKPRRPLDLAVGAVVLSGALSLPGSVYPAGTLEGTLLLSFYALTYVLLGHALDEPGRHRVAGWALAGGLLGAALGLAGYWLSRDWLPFHRVAGTFDYPNSFAQYALFLYLGVTGAAAGGGKVRLLGPAAVLLFAAWSMSLSRGSQYTLLPGLLAVGWLLPRPARRRFAAFAAVTALLGVLVAGAVFLGQPALRRSGAEGAGAAFWSRLGSFDQAAPEAAPPRSTAAIPGGAAVVFTENAAARFSFWITAGRMITARPWLGWGLGSFARVFPAHQADPEFFSVSAHNHYLQWWAETGLPGVAAFAALGLIYLVTVGRMAGKAGGLLAGTAGGMAALALHLGVDVDWEIPALTLLLWGSLALVRGDAPRAGGGRRPRAMALVVLLAAVAALPYLSQVRLEEGREAMAAGDLDRAMARFQEAAGLHPLDSLPRAFLAHGHQLAWRGSGDPGALDQAVRAAELAVRLDRHNPPLRNRLGLLYAERALALGRPADLDRARRELAAAVALFPGWGEYRYDLADFHWRTGNRAAAGAEIHRLLEAETAARRLIRPSERDYADRLFADVRVLAAVIRRAEGDRAGALALVEEALLLRPDHPEALRLREELAPG